ncbi:hypothetical protein LR48_Vigan09g070800 [Vigna angularis]|uniref:Uncharacterized protein n=1 Tax=Phaseolus angularis TaxID=3914 RepID=A0A0L9VBM1_PHAAN|nr:hypothetical protein LR48_Vigan09g070800 [Vigna angularis]
MSAIKVSISPVVFNLMDTIFSSPIVFTIRFYTKFFIEYHLVPRWAPIVLSGPNISYKDLSSIDCPLYLQVIIFYYPIPILQHFKHYYKGEILHKGHLTLKFLKNWSDLLDIKKREDIGGRINIIERLVSEQGRVIEELRDEQKLKEMIGVLMKNFKKSDKSSKGNQGFLNEVTMGIDANKNSLQYIKKAKKPLNEGENSINWEEERENDTINNNGTKNGEEESFFPWVEGVESEGRDNQCQTTRAIDGFEVQNIKGSTRVHPTVNNME